MADRKQYWCQGYRPSCGSNSLRGSSKGTNTCCGFADTGHGSRHFAARVRARSCAHVCGRATVYSPLKQFGASTTAKRVSIDCAEDLGHFGILFAKAMGADVKPISHSSHQKADADVKCHSLHRDWRAPCCSMHCAQADPRSDYLHCQSFAGCLPCS
jgi:D-arabinose 1-dehydrogenase-like Zn-dependent alcohol dehydrogenase